MAKATSNPTTNITADAMRLLSEHWRRRAAEYEQEGRTAEAASALRLARHYAHTPEPRHSLTFDTTEYRFSHGKEPRGRGSWAFAPYRDLPADHPLLFFTPSMTYAEAKRYAREKATGPMFAGFRVLYVLP